LILRATACLAGHINRLQRWSLQAVFVGAATWNPA
jgi:hypothetical protein